MTRLLHRLNRFWFAEAPTTTLALLRVVVGGFALQYVAMRYAMYMKMASSDPQLFEPVGLAWFLDQPIPAAGFQLLLIATLLANLAFVLGWRYRYTGPVYAVLLLCLLCYRNSWSMIYHSDNVLVFHVLILGLTPAADAIALDTFTGASRARHKTRLSNPWRGRDPAGDWQYGWPIRLMCTVTVLTYFLSGVAKVAGPLGWEWAGGEALRSQMAVDGLRKALLGDGAPPLVFTLYNNVLLFTMMGIGTLILELGAPAALLEKRLGRWWAVSAFLMHWGIFFIMGIKFRYQLAGLIFAPFFDVERLAGWARSVRERLSAAHVPQKAAANH
jgi:hypothetical protein